MLGWSLIIATMSVVVLNDAQIDWRKKLLEEYWKKTYLADPKTRPNIVVLGNSLVGRSFPLSSEVSHFFGEKYSWANVWIGGASYKDFSGFFLESTQHYDLIIINLDTLAHGPSRRGRRTLKNYPNMVKRRLLFDPIQNIFEEFYLASQGWCKSRDKESIEKIVDNINKRYNFNKNTFNERAQFLQSLKAVSKKIVVVELPRAGSLTEKVGASLISYRDHFSTFLQEQGVEFVSLGESMPEDHYCDGSHPNDRGRKVRRAQLLNLVEDRLSSRQ